MLIRRSAGGRGGAARLLRPDGPFAAIAGESRRAAWRRTMLRRVIAAGFVLAAIVVVLLRPGPLGSAARSATTPAGGGVLAGSPLGGASGASDRGTGNAGGEEPGGRVEPATALEAGVVPAVRLPELGGSALVPVGSVGMSLPAVEPTMAARLRAGDLVDVFASGARSPVARGARVLDVVGVGDTPGIDAATSTDADGAKTARSALIFVAVSASDAARVSGAQRPDVQVTGFWFAVRGRAATTDPAR